MVVRKAKVTSKGQVTIPLEIRKALNLREGDSVSFEVDEDGNARLRPELPENPFQRWAGAWREGSGKSLELILQEERARRE